MTGLREIIFDTETTGFDARGEDRITEIGCVEVVDLVPTGNTYQTYLDPQRDLSERITEITGLTREFLTGKPLFADAAQEFLDFIGDSPLVAHNADFDRGFINAELERAGYDPIDRSRFVDTVKIAREKFPGAPASLDALCKRFDISLSSRDKHGALIDAHLLAEVYLDLRGGRVRKLKFDDPDKIGGDEKTQTIAAARPAPLAARLTEAECAAHRRFMDELGEETVWHYYWRKQERQNKA